MLHGLWLLLDRSASGLAALDEGRAAELVRVGLVAAWGEARHESLRLIHPVLVHK